MGNVHYDPDGEIHRRILREQDAERARLEAERKRLEAEAERARKQAEIDAAMKKFK